MIREYLLDAIAAFAALAVLAGFSWFAHADFARVLAALGWVR